MTNRELTRTFGGAACIAMVAALAMSVGCSKEPEKVVQAPPPAPEPPPPPAKPPVTPVDELMARLGIDERVVLPESEAPNNDPDRIALLEFFDGVARGDESAIRPMLSLLDQQELDALIESGDWESSTARIDRIELMTGTSPLGDNAVLARIETGFEFQPQLWYYEGDEMGDHMFEAAPQPPDVMNELHGANWIDAWHALLNLEMELANTPDEDLPDLKRSIAVNEEREANETGLGGGTTPGGGRGLRGPSGPGIAPPGAGGEDAGAGGGG